MLSLETILLIVWLLPIIGVLIIYVTAVRQRQRYLPLRTERIRYMQGSQRSGASRPSDRGNIALAHDYNLCAFGHQATLYLN